MFSMNACSSCEMSLPDWTGVRPASSLKIETRHVAAIIACRVLPVGRGTAGADFPVTTCETMLHGWVMASKLAAD